jgi:hypothetical protein
MTARARQPAKRAELLRVYEAARGLCFGTDWNRGTHALTHKYRAKLIAAVDAIEELPDRWAVEHAHKEIALGATPPKPARAKKER